MTGEKGSDRSGGSRSRRSYLKLAGLAATGIGLGGVAWGLDQAESARPDVHLLDELPDGGEEPIDDVLAAVAADDTTVRLPEGTYRIESFRPGPLSNFTLRGDGATLVPPDDNTDIVVGLMGSDITLGGFTFDYTAEDTAPQVVVRCSDGLLVEDCAFVGTADVYGGRGRSAHEYHLMPAVTHPQGKGTIRNVSLADGSASPSNRGGIWVSGDSAGRLAFENVHLERWANNSLYVAESEGTLAVRDSRFVNNNVGGPRIGAAISNVTNTTVVSDSEVPVQAFTGKRRSRGLWIDDNCEDVHVENCEFVMTGPHASDAIIYQDWSTPSPGSELLPGLAGRLTGSTRIGVSDCQFVMSDGRQAISHRSEGATVTTQNIDVRTGN